MTDQGTLGEQLIKARKKEMEELRDRIAELEKENAQLWIELENDSSADLKRLVENYRSVLASLGRHSGDFRKLSAAVHLLDEIEARHFAKKEGETDAVG